MGGETPYTLSRGAHPSADDGRCAMEWVAYLAGERHSDEPRCVCRALRQFTVRLNDSMPDDVRQKLRPYLARMIGSADDRLAPSRSWRMVDWAAREVVPLTLETVGRGDLSAELRALRPVRQYPSAQQAADVLQRASGAAGLDARVRHVVRVAASAARGRVPSQVAETAARAAQDVGVAGIWPRVLSLLDELLPGEVVTVPEADNWRAVCDATEAHVRDAVPTRSPPEPAGARSARAGQGPGAARQRPAAVGSL